MGTTILIAAAFAMQSRMIEAQSPAVQKAVQLLGERNQAAIDRIKTLSCSYRTDDIVKPQFDRPDFYVEFPVSGQYLRKGNDFYSSEHWPTGRHPNWTITICRQGKVIWISLPEYSKPIPLRPTASAVSPDEDPGEHSTPWNRFPIRHPTPRELRSSEPFRSILTQPHRLLDFRRVVVNGVPLDYVKLSHRIGILECWFDPAWEGWVRKSAFTWHPQPEYRTEREIQAEALSGALPPPQPHLDFRTEREVLAVARSDDGAIIPTVIDKRSTEGGRLMGHARTTLSDVKLNGPLEFVGMIGPSLQGAECDDLTTNTRYLIDAAGNRIGPETPIPPKLPPEILLYPTEPIDEGRETLGKKDIAAFGILLAAAIAATVWIIRNRNRRSAEALRG